VLLLAHRKEDQFKKRSVSSEVQENESFTTRRNFLSELNRTNSVYPFKLQNFPNQSYKFGKFETDKSDQIIFTLESDTERVYDLDFYKSDELKRTYV